MQYNTPVIHFPSTSSLIFVEQAVSAGFPNPCESFLTKSISLDDLLIKRKSSTFLVKVVGDSMKPTIPNDSILVVDKSIKAINNSIVVAEVTGEFIVKQLILIKGNTPILRSHNSIYSDIPIDESNEDTTEIWGVVTSYIKQL